MKELRSAVSGRTRRHHARLRRRVDRALRWSGREEVFASRAPDVSGWSVGQHLEHLLRSDRGILGWVESVAAGRPEVPGPGSPEVSGPGSKAEREEPVPESGGGPSLQGWLVLLTGYIPRGRGRAPVFTRPEGMDREEVAGGFAELTHRTRRLASGLDAVALSSERMPHPILGGFTASQWLRFAEVHHAHHERVIRDILRAAGT